MSLKLKSVSIAFALFPDTFIVFVPFKTIFIDFSELIFPPLYPSNVNV